MIPLVPPTAVLCVQSQVVYGHVGNAAAVLALQRQGFEVWPVPTALLAHHAGYGPPPGRVLADREVAALIAGVFARGGANNCAAVVTGWLGTAANGEAALAAVAEVKAANPKALYLCDPVIGDDAQGIYAPAEVAAFFRDRALAACDVLAPNRFELAWLAGQEIAHPGDAIAAAGRLLENGTRLVACTSTPLPDAPGMIGTLACTRAGAWLARTERLNRVPQGAGDLFAALLLARLLKGANAKKALTFAVAATFGVLKQSQGGGELNLIAAQDQLVHPTWAPEAARLK